MCRRTFAWLDQSFTRLGTLLGQQQLVRISATRFFGVSPLSVPPGSLLATGAAVRENVGNDTDTDRNGIRDIAEIACDRSRTRPSESSIADPKSVSCGDVAGKNDSQPAFLVGDGASGREPAAPRSGAPSDEASSNSKAAPLPSDASDLRALLHSLQKERGATSAMVASGGMQQGIHLMVRQLIHDAVLVVTNLLYATFCHHAERRVVPFR